ncbi:MAG: hypothetical protein RJQ09_21695 [Cyclobacteriaceae bacterium]
MLPLDKDLQLPKKTLIEFVELSIKVLKYLPNVLSSYESKGNYRIYLSSQAGLNKYIRPINIKLFISDPDELTEKYELLRATLNKRKKSKNEFSFQEKLLINSVIYTLQQSVGAGLDLLVNPNSARKHVGNRFEELIASIFTEVGIANKKLVLQIPYETDEGQKIYKCENDLILSPYDEVRSTESATHKDEVIVSIKTTSKDRMSKIFIDKILLERFVGHNQKVIGIFLNDVQRKEGNNISFTLVSGLFMVYSKFLVKLDGIYYLDSPPNAQIRPYNKHMHSFADLISTHIWKLLTP